MPPGCYVLRHATRALAVDYSNASSLALLNPRTRAWSDRALAATGIDAAMLPELGAGTRGGRYDHRRVRGGERDSIPSTTVAVGCGDEMAATLGAGVFAPGDVCDVVGTAEPVCAASDEPREDPTMLVECHPHADPDAWLLENPGFVSGGNLRWWRDQFAPIERDAEAVGLGDAYDFLSTEAAHVARRRGGARVPAVHARRDGARVERRRAGRVLRAHARAHARPHDARDPRGQRVRAARHPRRDARTRASTCGGSRSWAGGAKGPLWRQIKADVTGLPVRVPKSVETTATGAAILAAVGAGVHSTWPTRSRRSCLPSRRARARPRRREAYDDAYGGTVPCTGPAAGLRLATPASPYRRGGDSA